MCAVGLSFSPLRLISFRCCSDGPMKFRTRKSSNLGMTSTSSVTRESPFTRGRAWPQLGSLTGSPT